ncbi:MAG TPA: hypothetical protein VGH51_05210 [Candidatus Angelobacter sp.]|jgi:hypothetical protein
MREAGILLLLILPGCSSNKLDQNTAEGLAKRFLSSNPAGFSLHVGRVGTQCPYLNDKGRQADLPLDLTPQSQPTTVFAEMAGYVTVNADGDGYWKVALTEPGKKVFQQSGSRHVTNAALNGCDYESDFLNVAVPELVKVTAITPGENSTEIAFVWKWNTTDLGQELRKDGKLYSMLAPSQREEIQRYINHIDLGYQKLTLPVPGEDYTGTGSVQVKKGANGWGPA